MHLCIAANKTADSFCNKDSCSGLLLSLVLWLGFSASAPDKLAHMYCVHHYCIDHSLTVPVYNLKL